MIVLCIGVAGAMISMSGFADVWGTPQPETGAAQDALEEQSEAVNPAGPEGSASGPVSSGESSIVGLIVDGSRSLAGLAAAVALLPLTLMNLGLPGWFALPVGSLAYIVTGIGVIEFATNREWT
jgi:hypothetical protein